MYIWWCWSCAVFIEQPPTQQSNQLKLTLRITAHHERLTKSKSETITPCPVYAIYPSLCLYAYAYAYSPYGICHMLTLITLNVMTSQYNGLSMSDLMR